MFHVQDGLYFERLTSTERYGWVRVVKKDERGEAILWETVISPEGWASVTASMSCFGENSNTFRMFLALQK